jgi:GTP cyclohydrolase II
MVDRYRYKEGRALGEVIKYLVYNARKRGGDTADKYFTRTDLSDTEPVQNVGHKSLESHLQWDVSIYKPR